MPKGNVRALSNKNSCGFRESSMHAYSITNTSRMSIIFVIALTTIAVCPHVNSLTGQLPFVGPIATSSLFFGVFAVVEHVAWRWRWLRWIFRTPDLSGDWLITGTTSGADNVEREWNATATITQTWTHMSVVLVAERSTSESKIAGMQLLAGQGGRLVYTYENVRTAEEDSLLDHRGTCELHFNKGNDQAAAYYFTDRSRQTVGSMTWTRETEN